MFFVGTQFPYAVDLGEDAKYLIVDAELASWEASRSTVYEASFLSNAKYAKHLCCSRISNIVLKTYVYP